MNSIWKILFLLFYIEPTGFNAPNVVGSGPKYIDLTWAPPVSPNGVLQEYNIYQNGQFREAVSQIYFTFL